MTRLDSPLLAVSPNGEARLIPNSYEGIKAGLEEACFDFVLASPTAGFFIDDEGMLNGSTLNVAASMFASRPLYGPVVLCAAQTDDDGETLPPTDSDVRFMAALAAWWQAVVLNAAEVGQDVSVRANPDTIPPPTIVPMNEDEFEAWLQGR